MFTTSTKVSTHANSWKSEDNKLIVLVESTFTVEFLQVPNDPAGSSCSAAGLSAALAVAGGKVRGRFRVRNAVCRDYNSYRWGIVTPVDSGQMDESSPLGVLKGKSFWQTFLGILKGDEQTTLDLSSTGDVLQGAREPFLFCSSWCKEFECWLSMHNNSGVHA